MNYGIIDFEMTCDGKQEKGRFIDDGRMNKFKREIISIGFIAFDNKFNIIGKYFSYVKPVKNAILTEYCKNLTGITQTTIDAAIKSNDAFRCVVNLCNEHKISKIFSFGNMDAIAIQSTIKWNLRAKEKVNNLHIIKQMIVDINPLVMSIVFPNRAKCLGLSKTAKELNIEISDSNIHNSLNDAILLYEICKKLNIPFRDYSFMNKTQTQ